MLIRVTQGHEKGIGLEVFLKSFLMLDRVQQKSCLLYSFKETLENNLKLLKFPYKINSNSIDILSFNLPCFFLDKKDHPQSSVAINTALEQMTKNDVLFTLPTSKDQILHPFDSHQTVAGHTEYLRIKYANEFLCMFFKADDLNVLLLTDHLPLKDIPQTITEDLIIKKVSTTINHLTHIKNILIAGINPHAGENGLIGTEDQVINKAIIRLKQIYPTHTFQGPISGDTMYFMHQNESDLLVYPYHDQGLGVFKAIKKTYGINFTLGLPFKRLSVDHGTAFALFGKNSANYSGALYCLETVFK